MFSVTGKSIAELRTALEDGEVTAVDLVQEYQARIAAYDHGDTVDGGVPLNAVIVDNPDALSEARASDTRRAEGRTLGPLDGIPYTAKESYLAKGLTASAGSPAFADLVAQKDAFTIERLRAGGAILLGLTTMPPMANGGMQRGLPDQCLRLRVLQRLRLGDGGGVRRLRTRRGDLVVRPRPGVLQLTVRVHPVAWGDLHPG